MDIRVRLIHVIETVPLLLLVAVPVHAVSPQGRNQVLIIHSYHSGLTWTDAVTSGIRDALSRSDSDIHISVEYLDARRYPKSGWATGRSQEIKKLFRVSSRDVNML